MVVYTLEVSQQVPRMAMPGMIGITYNNRQEKMRSSMKYDMNKRKLVKYAEQTHSTKDNVT